MTVISCDLRLCQQPDMVKYLLPCLIYKFVLLPYTPRTWVCLKTAGRRCNDRRTPQFHPNDQYERLTKRLTQCVDVYFSLFRHI